MYQSREAKAQREALNKLSRAIMQLRNEGECRDFIRDLCTPQELISMADRLQVAGMLSSGERQSYRKISASTGVSTATITRVGYWLRNGRGGYRRVLQRLGQSDGA